MSRGPMAARTSRRAVGTVRQKARYGYCRLHALLELRDHEVNVKRAYRLYLAGGLERP
jgi:hypothetical protein